MGVYCLHKSKINNTASCRLQGSLQPTSQPTWWNFGFGPWKISEISNKSQKAHVCALGSELVWNLLVPPCYLKWSMTNINMEVVFTYPSYMCGERMRDPHTLTRFARAGHGKAWRRARAHDMRMNGPPKSGSSPCGCAVSFCSFSFWSFDLQSSKRTRSAES